ncbi:glycosyltransferase family 2 protein [Ancylobacter mangrovi]|uniref:glycosyltransferase family 2 protein n=1 Tax=Ancylobacter mangrovi TaxID=2972472 RepID=UPI002161B244|nr:glycosyltransferase family 2 protein [Ancylobacter mangrovi]MCS0501272.1 glycosyltransferase [Ancylobacter mangrovi]
MSAGPQLAVIIACHNYERFVERAIRSVLDQAHPSCELVVVDDGSTDRSWEVIGRTGATAWRIANSGQLGACRYGLERTSAPFVLFLDADDELKPGSLDRIIGMLDPGVAKLQFSLARIDGDGHELDCGPAIFDTFRGREATARQVLRSGVYKTPSTSGNVFRRDLCEVLRDVDYEPSIDGVILFAAPFFGDVVSTSEELGRYRIHEANDSALHLPPEPRIIEREIARFLTRMRHLREIVRARAPGRELADPRKTFFFRERSFYLDVASGRRPPAASLPGLLVKLLGEQHSLKHKAGLAAFFLLAGLSSPERAKVLLAYRGQSLHRRSALGFARVILAGRPPAADR